MKRSFGKELLRNKPSKYMIKRIRTHFIYGVILTIVSLVLIINLILSLITSFSIWPLIYLLLFILVFVLSLYLLLYGLQIFFAYIVIFEGYITVRKSGVRAFLKCYKIPFNQISEVEIKEDSHRYYSRRSLLINTTSYGTFKINLRCVLNFEEIKESINQRIRLIGN